MARKVLLVLSVVAFSAIIGYMGRAVPVREQMPAFEGLRTTASIVFTVLGIWMALIYPDVLQALTQNWRQGRERQLPRLVRLFEPLVECLAIVAGVSLLVLARPLAVQLPLTTQATVVVRGVVFGVLTLLTLVQIRALIAMVAPVLHLHRRVANEEYHARARSGFPEPTNVRDVSLARPLD